MVYLLLLSMEMLAHYFQNSRKWESKINYWDGHIASCTTHSTNFCFYSWKKVSNWTWILL